MVRTSDEPAVALGAGHAHSYAQNYPQSYAHGYAASYAHADGDFEARLWEAFCAADTDGSGDISKRQVYRSMISHHHTHLPRVQAPQ